MMEIRKDVVEQLKKEVEALKAIRGDKNWVVIKNNSFMDLFYTGETSGIDGIMLPIFTEIPKLCKLYSLDEAQILAKKLECDVIVIDLLI